MMIYAPVLNRCKRTGNAIKALSKTHILLAVFIVAGSLRLVNLTAPVLGHHSWRQADTAAMARNFVEERFNILYPAIDWRGATRG